MERNKGLEKRILLGQCFNNACTLITNVIHTDEVVNIPTIFDYAEQLYDEALKRNWLEYSPDNIGALAKTITEKEGKAMDPDKKEKEVEVVI